LGTGQQLQWQKLLEQLPPDTPLEQLQELFVPIIAKDRLQQERLYRLFEQVLAKERVKLLEEEIPQEPELEEVRYKRHWWWVWSVVLPILAFSLWWLLRTPGEATLKGSDPPPLQEALVVEPNGTEEKCFLSQGVDSSLLIPKLNYCDPTLVDTIQGRFGRHLLLPNGCLHYLAGEQEGQDTICLRLGQANGRKDTIELVVFVERRLTAPKLVEEDVKERSIFPEKVVPRSIDLRALAIPPPNPYWAAYIKYEYWIKGALALLLGLGLVWLLWYRAKKRRKLVAEMQQNDKPPYIWNIKIDGLESIQMNAAFDEALHQLRQRVNDDFFKLDINRTVHSTIAAGGQTQFEYRQLTRPPEYLLLIDSTSQSNHRAQLFDYIYRLLRENEVHVTRFFYRGDPRALYNEEYPLGLHLVDLQNRYAQSRLLVLGKGYQLLDPKGKLSKWSQIFHSWTQRALLSPQPLSQWSAKERQLGQLFQLLPATLQGLHYLVRQLDKGEEAEPQQWYTQITDAQQQPLRFENKLITDLEATFGPKGLQWIAACAIYPRLHWDLTRYLGQLLSTEEDDLNTIDRLAQLSRLSWFVEGNIPQEARRVLLSYLEEAQPEQLQRLRGALHELLQENHPPKDSVAFEDHRMSVALNEWLLTKDKNRKKELEKEISQLLDQGVEPDFAVIKYLQRERSPLDFVVPDSWKKYLHQGGYPGLGWQRIWREAFTWAFPVWLTLSSLLFLTPSPSFDKCETPTQYTLDGDRYVLCLENAADSLLWWEHQTRDALEQGQLQRADSFLNLVIAQGYIDSQLVNDRTVQAAHLLRQDRLKDLAEGELPSLDPTNHNTALASLNYARTIGFLHYNLGLGFQMQAVQHETIDTSYRLYRDSTCYHWTRAAELLLGSDADVELAHSWCRNMDWTILSLQGQVRDSLTSRPLADIQFRLGDGREVMTDAQGNYAFNLPNVRPLNIQMNFNLLGYKTKQIVFNYQDTVPNTLPLIRLQKAVTAPIVDCRLQLEPEGKRYGDITFYACKDDPNIFYFLPRFSLSYFENGLPKLGVFHSAECNNTTATPQNSLLYADFSYNLQHPMYVEAVRLLQIANPAANVEGPLLERLDQDMIQALFGVFGLLQNVQTTPREIQLDQTQSIQVFSSLTPVAAAITEEAIRQVLLGNLNLGAPEFQPLFNRADSLIQQKNPALAGLNFSLQNMLLIEALDSDLDREQIMKQLLGLSQNCIEERRLYQQVETISALAEVDPSSATVFLQDLFRLRRTVIEPASLTSIARASINNRDGILIRVDTIQVSNWKAQGMKFRFHRSLMGVNDYELLDEKWGSYQLFDINATPGIWYEYGIEVQENDGAPLFLSPDDPILGYRPPATNPRVTLPQMQLIQGGTYTMGNTFDATEGNGDETPHEVSLNSFYMGAYEVSFAEYDLYCVATGQSLPSDENWGRGEFPVINVSWYDVVRYCNWLSLQHGFAPAYQIDTTQIDPNNQSSVDELKWTVTPIDQANGYRLPTEAEWEYAARQGGQKVRFGNGKDIADPKEMNFDGSADYKENYSVVGEYRAKTVAVNSFNPNALGLYNMSGNVWEWCWDWYADYDVSVRNNPKGVIGGQYRVVRGGSWFDNPNLCRASYRFRYVAYSEDYIIGFRLVRRP